MFNDRKNTVIVENNLIVDETSGLQIGVDNSNKGETTMKSLINIKQVGNHIAFNLNREKAKEIISKSKLKIAELASETTPKLKKGVEVADKAIHNGMNGAFIIGIGTVALAVSAAYDVAAKARPRLTEGRNWLTQKLGKNPVEEVAITKALESPEFIRNSVQYMVNHPEFAKEMIEKHEFLRKAFFEALASEGKDNSK